MSITSQQDRPQYQIQPLELKTLYLYPHRKNCTSYHYFALPRYHIDFLHNVFQHILQQRLNRPHINIVKANIYRASILLNVRRFVDQIHIVYGQEASRFGLQSEV